MDRQWPSEHDTVRSAVEKQCHVTGKTSLRTGKGVLYKIELKLFFPAVWHPTSPPIIVVHSFEFFVMVPRLTVQAYYKPKSWRKVKFSKIASLPGSAPQTLSQNLAKRSIFRRVPVLCMRYKVSPQPAEFMQTSVGRREPPQRKAGSGVSPETTLRKVGAARKGSVCPPLVYKPFSFLFFFPFPPLPASPPVIPSLLLSYPLSLIIFSHLPVS